ncbi:MAG: hypothetical protein PHF00_06480 [Elusimicrobia bacterium]|nr:hypothetical protein [Elusimicrobiota bacterium]
MALLAAKNLPDAKPTPGQIGWREFFKLVAESRAKHPEYWYDFRKEFGK